MKRVLQVVSFCLLGTLAVNAYGQRPGVPFRAARSQARVSLGSGLPPVGPIPPLGLQVQPFRAAFPGQRTLAQPGMRGRGFTSYATVYGWGAAYYPPQQNVVVVQLTSPPTEPRAPQPVREPAASAIREYEWPGTAELEPVEREPVYFAIVLKDHSEHPAVAVWAQDKELHYLTPEGAHERISVGSVDRKLTKQLNRRRGLRLRLPILRQ